jgi:hypothetical protein
MGVHGDSPGDFLSGYLSIKDTSWTWGKAVCTNPQYPADMRSERGQDEI